MFSTKIGFEGCFDVPRLCVTSSCIFFLIVFLWHDDEMITKTKITMMKKTTKMMKKTMTITVMIKI